MQFEGIVLSINEIVVVFKSMQNRNKLETSLKQYKQNYSKWKFA